MNAIRVLLLGATALLWFQSAASDASAAVGGHTTATADSIKGLRETLQIAAACFRIETIFADEVPPDFDPKSIPKMPTMIPLKTHYPKYNLLPPGLA